MDAKVIDVPGFEIPRGGLGNRLVRRPISRTVLASGAALVLAGLGMAWIALPASNVSTDDAYLAADTTTVAPKISGLVAQVLVEDNQAVKTGQPLVRIETEEFDAKVAAAQGALDEARAQVAAALAALLSQDAEEKLAAANVEAAQTSIRSAKAELDRAAADRQRFEALATRGNAARSDAERTVATAIAAEQNVAKVEALLAVAIQSADVTSAKRAERSAAVATAQANVAKANAALALAQQDQRHTLILAPIDGIIGNRQVRVGDYVQPGTQLLSLVPLHALYVTANFKETQMARMHAGQPVTIKVDGLPGADLKGTVDSLAPGSGSTFSLLPFEPGTGNFTKIVQRVPVKIRFDPDQSTLDQLRAGLSVTAKVKLQP